MKVFVATLAAFLAVASAKPAENLMPTFFPTSSDPRIVFGEEADKGEFPWQVSVRTSSHICGGSFISERAVLTAAHCLGGRINTIEFGTNKLGSGSFVDVDSQTRHPDYNSNALTNDFGVLCLAESVEMGEGVSTIMLSDRTADGDKDVELSGWGVTTENGGSLTSTLQKATFSALSDDVCEAEWYPSNWPEFDPEQMLCVDTSDSSPCNGDSGGALIISDGQQVLQVGVVSFGVNGCRVNEGFPAVFSDVAAEKKWIMDTAGAC